MDKCNCHCHPQWNECSKCYFNHKSKPQQSSWEKEFKKEHCYQDPEGTWWIEEQGAHDTEGIIEFISNLLLSQRQELIEKIRNEIATYKVNGDYDGDRFENLLDLLAKFEEKP